MVDLYTVNKFAIVDVDSRELKDALFYFFYSTVIRPMVKTTK